jgi:hypothetical protein
MRPRIITECRLRLECYGDDFAVAFRSWKNASKVLAAAVYVLFTSIGPAITFSSYLVGVTQNQYGVVEVLLSTALTGIVYSLVGGQPLVILGVTGPVSVFSETVFVLLGRWYSAKTIFLPFMFWVSLWATIFHLLSAFWGICDHVYKVTRFSCEVFGAFTGIIYLYTAVKDIAMISTNQPADVALLTVLLALTTWWLGLQLTFVKNSVLFNRHFRDLVSNYAIPMTVVLMSALYHAPSLKQVKIGLLPVPQTFRPSNNRSSWLVDPLALPFEAIFIAIIPGIILTVLFFFDHNVSSLLTQEKRFNLAKPPAYNLDFFVIGVCIFLTGLLGLPPTNGLIPQAPLHVKSLAFVQHEIVDDPDNPQFKIQREFIGSVVEQRVSNLIQSILTGVAVVAPLGLRLLGLIPVAVLSGLVLIMGIESFIGNQFCERLFLMFCVTERKHRLSAAPHTWPSIHHVPTRWWVIVTIFQFLLLALTFGVTLTPAAILFPVFVVLLVPLRSWFLPKIMAREYLEAIDSTSFALYMSSQTETLTVELELDAMRVEVYKTDDELAQTGGLVSESQQRLPNGSQSFENQSEQ